MRRQQRHFQVEAGNKDEIGHLCGCTKLLHCWPSWTWFFPSSSLFSTLVPPSLDPCTSTKEINCRSCSCFFKCPEHSLGFAISPLPPGRIHTLNNTEFSRRICTVDRIYKAAARRGSASISISTRGFGAFGGTILVRDPQACRQRPTLAY